MQRKVWDIFKCTQILNWLIVLSRENKMQLPQDWEHFVTLFTLCSPEWTHYKHYLIHSLPCSRKKVCTIFVIVIVECICCETSIHLAWQSVCVDQSFTVQDQNNDCVWRSDVHEPLVKATLNEQLNEQSGLGTCSREYQYPNQLHTCSWF